jgi:hypothetical protein
MHYRSVVSQAILYVLSGGGNALHQVGEQQHVERLRYDRPRDFVPRLSHQFFIYNEDSGELLRFLPSDESLEDLLQAAALKVHHISPSGESQDYIWNKYFVRDDP